MIDAVDGSGDGSGPAKPTIRRVDLDMPWAWLSAGWRDLRSAPGVGLVYGAIYAVFGCGFTTILWLNDILYVSLPLAAVFTLLGPLLAVGLYDASRRIGRGETVSLGQTLGAWRSNGGQIALMGVALMLFALAWMRLAFLIFFLFFSQNPPRPEALFFVDVFLSAESLPFLATGTIIGGILAAMVFGISVVSIPLLLDRPETNVLYAIVTSVRVCLANFWTMALWAWLIAVFIGVGLLTAYVGLIVTLPLIGHATWHAYKDLVSWEQP